VPLLERAFTIVELLIVIVIIGILATITIVAFNGIQERARASAVSAGLNQASKKLELYTVDNGGYPTTLADAGMNDGNGVAYQYTAAAAPSTTYCITGTQGSTSYWISNTSKSPTKGGCPGHGQGGVAAVTNLATNPSVETSGGGWLSRWYGSGGNGTLALTSLASHDGLQGYRKTWTVAGGGQDIGMSYALSSVTPGSPYSFGAYIRSSVTTGHKPFIIWKDSAGTQIGSIQFGAEVSIPANTWYRLAITNTAPANAASVVFVWGPYPSSGSPSAIVGQTLDFDSLMITQSPSLPSYADGSSPNWVWSGATNSSTSTGPAL